MTHLKTAVISIIVSFLILATTVHASISDFESRTDEQKNLEEVEISTDIINS